MDITDPPLVLAEEREPRVASVEASAAGASVAGDFVSEPLSSSSDEELGSEELAGKRLSVAPPRTSLM
jgi:hypothetical protein